MIARAGIIAGAAFALITASWGGLAVFTAVVVAGMWLLGRVTR